MKKVFIQTVWILREGKEVSLSSSCRLFGIRRQGIYQSISRYRHKSERMKPIKPLVESVRMEQIRLGTRKLYHLLKEEFITKGIEIGRDGLFKYLKQEHVLIYPKKNYTRTINSKHGLRKYPNLMKDILLYRPEHAFVNDITYVKSQERTYLIDGYRCIQS